MATGNWGLKMNVSKQGVSQVLNRLSYLSTISHIRRIQTPNSDNGKLIPPRKLHASHWGYVCPSETPEGQSVGIVKNLNVGKPFTLCSSTLSLSLSESYSTTLNFTPDKSLPCNSFLILSIVGGSTISYAFILATRYAYDHFDGLLWPGRFLGFALGISSYAILTWLVMGEGISLKTFTSLILSAGIISVQLFWK